MALGSRRSSIRADFKRVRRQNAGAEIDLSKGYRRQSKRNLVVVVRLRLRRGALAIIAGAIILLRSIADLAHLGLLILGIWRGAKKFIIGIGRFPAVVSHAVASCRCGQMQ